MTCTQLSHFARLGFLGILMVSLCGCFGLREYVQNGFKVGPNYCRPVAPVAQQWIDADDQRVRSEFGDLSCWWALFNDPVLDSLINNAYQQNLTLREAGFRVLEARAELAKTIGFIFPQTQNASGYSNRLGLSQAVANRQFIADRFYNQYDLGFNLAWELDFWGRFRRAIEASQGELDASVENYDDVLVTLLGDVASTYTQVRVVEQQIEYVRTNVGLQREALAIANARFKGGQATELDVDQAQSNLSNTEALVPQLEIQLRQATNRLCILMGMPPEELRSRLGPGIIPLAPPDAIVGIPAELLTRRPEVRREERLAAAQCARIGVAVSELLPHISITGTIGTTAEQFGDLFSSQAFRGTVGPTFSWAILNYGRLINGIRVEDARFQEIVARYQNKVLKAGEEAENGLVTYLKSHQQAKFQQEAVVAAEKAVRIAIAQYKGGLTDFNRVALLEQNLVQQQNLLAQAQGQIAQGLIQVYRALGGGWEIRCQPVMPVALPPAGSHETEIAPLPLEESKPDENPKKPGARLSDLDPGPIVEKPAAIKAKKQEAPEEPALRDKKKERLILYSTDDDQEGS